MIQYMSDYANVDTDTVIDYLCTYGNFIKKVNKVKRDDNVIHR